MKNYTHKSKYFCGNKISEYGLKNGYVDYLTLSKAFESVLCNDITKLFYGEINGKYSEVDLVNGHGYDEDIEIFQYYIIDENGASLLKNLTNEIVYYLPLLNMHIWGVTHFNTSWDYVLTNIKIEL